MRRIRLINLMSISFVLVGFPFVFQYLSMGVPLVAAGVALAILAGLANLWLLRRFRRPDLSGHIGTMIVYVLLLLSNSVSGGFYDPNFAWMYVVPAVAGFVINLRAVLFYFPLILLTTIAFFVFPHIGIMIPNMIPRENHAVQSLFNRLSAITAIAFLVFGFLLERQRAEKQIQRTREEAEKASLAKSEFLANMSHEIRTPLNAILGMGELLADAELQPGDRKYLSIMRNAGENLLELVNDILDIARFESGKLQLESIVFDPGELLRNTADMLALGAREKNLEFHLNVDPNIPSRLKGDPTRLRQILVNLLGNAVKFTQEGEIELKVEVVNDDEAIPLVFNDDDAGTRATLQFLVRDSGIGIPIEKWEQVFDAFTQADESTTRRFGGTGLGLAICSRLVELMSGRIWVMSIPDEGSSFYVRLPFIAMPERRRDPFRSNDERGNGMRLLVLDDDFSSRVLLGEYLRDTDIALTMLDGSERILETARASEPEAFDAVLLEYRLASRNGFELLRLLREQPSLRNADFMLIGSDDPTSEAEHLGIRHYLVKPIGKDALLAAMAEANARSAAMRVDKPLRILLAEDNEDNRLLIQAFLKDSPHRLEHAADGMEALNRFHEQQYDLILMDIQMPVLDGLEAVRRIRAWESENPSAGRVPVLALTAHALREEIEKSMKAGCDAHISKPVKRADLLRLITQFGVNHGAASGNFSEKNE